MTIWGEFRANWRNVVPPVLGLVALALVALTLRSCLSPEVDNPNNDELFAQYARGLDSGDPGLVVASTKLLGDLGKPKAIELIRPKLKADDPRIVGAALGALGKLGDKSVTAQLLESLCSDEPAVLAGAATGLGALQAEEAVKPIAPLLENRDYAVRLAAIVALGQIGDPAAEPALAKLESNPTAGLAPPPDDPQRTELEKALAAALEKLRKSK